MSSDSATGAVLAAPMSAVIVSVVAGHGATATDDAICATTAHEHN